MPIIAKENNLFLYKGSNFLKQKLVLSVLSGKPVKIIDIRSDHNEPGLKEYEICLIRLLDKITNGTEIELNESGTCLFFKPGLLLGGLHQHNCCVQRSIGYYLDVLIALGPFCKSPLSITLRGVTNSKESPSVDHIKASAIPLLKRFLVVDDGLELKINRRGLMPLGGGEIIFKCPVRRNLKTVQCLSSGMVKRFRGTAYAAKVSPALANRTVEAAKGVLLQYIPDVYIHTDQNRGKMSGNSTGYGVNLIAETTDGHFFSAEAVSNVRTEDVEPSIPEELGREAAQKILEEIYRGGCVDSTFQWLVALFMALGQKHVSKYLIGPLSQYTVYFLQHLRDFFGITFKLDNPLQNGGDSMPGALKVLMTCVGIGYTNVNKRII